MGKIYALTGMSGSGKSTIKSLCGLKKIVNCTTREPREGEIDGKDYHFITHDKHKENIALNRYVEYSSNNGNCYGILKEEFNRNEDLVVVIDYHGYEQLKKVYKSRVKGIYLKVNPIKTLWRMIDRGDGLDSAFDRFITNLDSEEYKRRNELHYHIDANKGIEYMSEQFKDITKKVVYLTGKITGMNLENRRRVFNKYESRLILAGYNVINPTSQPEPLIKDWIGYMNICLEMLTRRADYIFPVDDYENSDGKYIELEVAKKRLIPVLKNIEKEC